MRTLFIILITTMLFVSCNNTSNSVSENQEITMSMIVEIEDELFSDALAIPDAEKAQNLVDMYVGYADQNPKDSITPNLLFKAADISMNFRAPIKSISLFNRIINNYPDYSNIPTAMFLKGFVYEDQLQDYPNAQKSYMEFLEKYPNNEFSDDARVSLQNLGKTPEELIKEFENK